MDEAAGPRHIQVSHEAHAPCVLVTKGISLHGQEQLKHSFLKLFNAAHSEIKEPTSCEVVLQIIAAYFVCGVKYPDAYNDWLRFLEKYVHGQLCQKTIRTKPHASYTNFLLKFGP